MTEDELEKKAIQWIRSQGWNENNLPNDEYIQMCDSYIAGAKENGVVWHDLRKNPNDLPKRWGEYLTNIGVLVFDSSIDTKWCTLLCKACDYYEDVSDEVITWCELPKFEMEE